MFRFNRILLLILFFITCFSSYSQEYNPQVLENILEEISIETGSSPKLDELENIIENKIYLKQASISDFLQIPGFTSSEARNIIAIARLDRINNLNQIANILNLTENQILLLKLCTTLDYQTPKVKFLWRTRNKNYLEKVYGFEKNKFKGNALDLYNRATFYFNNYSAGFLTDKDPGEIHFADFFSAYFSGKIDNTKFILGDYYLELGMGNLLWKSFPIRKGAEVIYPALQKGRGIKPYRSSIDYNFFRGMAFENTMNLFNSANFKIISWYSHRNISATIDTTYNIASSIYKTGYYRTANEIKKKNSLNEKSYGLNLEFSNSLLDLGLISDYMLYNKSIESASSSVFSGKEGLLFSAYSFLNLGIWQFGAEISRDNNNNIAIKTGSEFDFNDFDLAFAYRRFPKDFRSQFGYNFGEFSYVSNEEGFYTGLKFKGLRNFVFSSYIDFYSSLGSTYFVNKPVKGIDLFFQTNWEITEKSNVIVRIRNENKTDAIKNANSEKKNLQKQISRVRIEYQGRFSNFLFRMRSEISYANFKNWIKDEFGIMTSSDLSWKCNRKFSLSGRIALFSTPSYKSAIWQYEMTVPGYMSTRALYGKGLRAYLTFGYTPFAFINLQLAYILMYKPDEETLGSSYLKIDGNQDNRVILQIDMKL